METVPSETKRLLDAALDHWIQQIARLQQISQRIRVAGRGACGAGLTPVLGAALLDPKETHPPLDITARARFGDRDALYVVAVFPGMAAARAGLKPGDAILRIGYHRARSTHQFYTPAVEKNQRLVLEIERGGQRMDLPIDRDPGCLYRAQLVVDEEVNAWVDGQTHTFTTAILRAIQDDVKLATIVGHELAHSIDDRNRRGVHARQVRSEERADYVGIYLATMAGYPVTTQDAEIERDLVSNVHYVTRRTSHPSTAERVAAFHRTIEEIEAKRLRGEPLTLDLR